MNIREKVLNRDPVMRMVLAFNNFIKQNSDWTNRIENVITNQFKGLSDYDFEYDKRLYSFYYQYINDKVVKCCVREYQTFYDNAKSFEYILFDYNLSSNNITQVYKSGAYSLTN